MENLLNPAIQCTDPDQLQFCLKISDEEYWYCEPNWYHEKLMPYTCNREQELIETYKGNPKLLLHKARVDEEVKAFVLDRQLWLCGSSKISDFEHGVPLQLLKDYGYKWDSFNNDAERNQIICEIYFEQHPMDFRQDI